MTVTDGAAVEGRFLDPGSADFLDDPHPIYDQLRAGGPIVRDPIGWSTIDYASSMKAFADLALSPGIDPLLESKGVEALWGEPGHTLTDSEGVDHQRLRRVVGPWFNPRRVEQLRGRVRSLVDEILVSADPDRPFDLMADLADVVPARLFCWMVGAPDSEAAHLASMSKTMLTVFTATEEMVEPVRAAKAEMFALTGELLASKRGTDGDDVTCLLLAAQAAGAIGEVDTFHLLEELLSASVDNTANTAGLAVWTLLRHPASFARLVDDVDLVPRAMEECGRFEPAIRHTIKYATAPTVVGGVDVAPGEFVTIRIAAAHRDPDIYEDPHRFDIDRDPPKPQLAFGSGRHFCLGAALGRMEVVEIIRGLTLHRPHATLADGVSMSLNAAGLVHALPLDLSGSRS